MLSKGSRPLQKSKCYPLHHTLPCLTLPSLKFTNAFAFGAPKLIGHRVTIWMLTYADMVIVNGMAASTCISSLLYSSNLGIHTSILFLNNPDREGKNLSVGRYVWEHNDQRPNTHTIPLNCDVCHSIRSWCPPAAVKREPGEAFTIPCLNVRPGGAKCTGKYHIAARPPSTALESPYIGIWYSYNLAEVK